jgi:hypothetical protein
LVAAIIGAGILLCPLAGSIAPALTTIAAVIAAAAIVGTATKR